MCYRIHNFLVIVAIGGNDSVLRFVYLAIYKIYINKDVPYVAQKRNIKLYDHQTFNGSHLNKKVGMSLYFVSDFFYGHSKYPHLKILDNK